MIVLLIALIFSLVGVSGLALYFYLLSRDKQKDKKQLMPFDSTLVAWWAAAFALLVCFVFFCFLIRILSLTTILDKLVILLEGLPIQS
ncbi:hypothetical protein PE143B_0130785 [Pseudomonas extremaustralis 14-3 substr. 14-3b]|nr:hypothetical protein PE143B_0130785 [Pseudomonas extremaustralis 14-3 substr. 14-3b]